jgi:amino acid permease
MCAAKKLHGKCTTLPHFWGHPKNQRKEKPPKKKKRRESKRKTRREMPPLKAVLVFPNHFSHFFLTRRMRIFFFFVCFSLQTKEFWTNAERVLFRKRPIENSHSIDGQPVLRRSLNALDLIGLGVGCIVGAGIFVLTGVVAKEDAGPGVVLSYLLSGISQSHKIFHSVSIASFFTKISFFLFSSFWFWFACSLLRFVRKVFR